MRIHVRIKLSTHDMKSIERFERSLKTSSYIIEGYATSGESDYFLTISTRDISTFESIHRAEISKLPGIESIKVEIALRKLPVNLSAALR
jgi:DNA-binding Lrp family transcriptional regulator